MRLRLPQVRDLDKLRGLLELLASGESDPDRVGRAMGAGAEHARRHAGYYREAAEILGMVEPGAWTISAGGRALVETRAGDEAERILLREAIAGAECLGRIGAALLAPEEPDVAALIEHAMEVAPHHAPATIARRVRDTLSWHRRLVEGGGPTRRGRARVDDGVVNDVGGESSANPRGPVLSEADKSSAVSRSVGGRIQKRVTTRSPASRPATAPLGGTVDDATGQVVTLPQSASPTGADGSLEHAVVAASHVDLPPPPRTDPLTPREDQARDPHRLVSGLARDAVELKLDTVDVCFLAALRLRADQTAAVELDEDTLVDVFEQVCELVEPEADNPRKRATHAIQRLRNQRLLARVDGTGIVREGSYALTSLASAIVGFFLEDERLTRESLALLTGAVIASLGEIRGAARSVRSTDEWRPRVIAPLRVTVGDLVGGIERRQRGLDAQQEEVQRKIGELLQSSWLDAMAQCQELLESTTSTLRELNDVLLRDSNQIQALLQELVALADDAGVAEAVEAIGNVVEQVDRLAAWGAARQQAWSGFYRYVHRFLRDVVRLDPHRAVSRRLVEQLRQWPSRPFFLLAAGEGRITSLRPITVRVDRPAVEQPRRDREARPTIVAADDRRLELEDLVRAALADGAADLSSVTACVLAGISASRRYGAAGEVAALVAKLARPVVPRPRPWVAVVPSLEIEDWLLDPLEEP